MSIIKQFNNKLNNSFEEVKPNNLSFKEQVDTVLKSVIQRNSSFKQALIIGAGKMEDFSLYLFVKYFGKTWVTDVDIDTTKQSLEMLGLEKKELQKIVAKEIEFTGFDSVHFFEEFRKTILAFDKYDEIELFLKEKFRQLKTFQFLPDKKEKFDFIYVSPIYTQLVYNQVLLECSLLRQNGYPENLLKFIENIVLDEMVEIINRFNQNIDSLLHKTGTLFVVSDVFEADKGSAFARRVAMAIKSKPVMEDLYKEYQEKYGMGLGDFGLFNLDEMLFVQQSKWLIWPYKRDKELIIKLKIYSKNKKHKEVIL